MPRKPLKEGDCVKLKGQKVYGFVRFEPSVHRGKHSDRKYVGVHWIGPKEKDRKTFVYPSRVTRKGFHVCRRVQHKAYGVTRKNNA